MVNRAFLAVCPRLYSSSLGSILGNTHQPCRMGLKITDQYIRTKYGVLLGHFHIPYARDKVLKWDQTRFVSPLSPRSFPHYCSRTSIILVSKLVHMYSNLISRTLCELISTTCIRWFLVLPSALKISQTLNWFHVTLFVRWFVDKEDCVRIIKSPGNNHLKLLPLVAILGPG